MSRRREKEGRGTVRGVGRELPVPSSSHMSSGGGAHAVKVKVIVTRYVQTDETHFKSVVQKLTGKDAVVTLGPKVDRPVADRKGAPPGRAEKGARPPCDPMAPAGPCRELQGMPKGLPSLEEISDLYGETNFSDQLPGTSFKLCYPGSPGETFIY